MRPINLLKVEYHLITTLFCVVIYFISVKFLGKLLKFVVCNGRLSHCQCFGDRNSVQIAAVT